MKYLRACAMKWISPLFPCCWDYRKNKWKSIIEANWNWVSRNHPENPCLRKGSQKTTILSSLLRRTRLITAAHLMWVMDAVDSMLSRQCFLSGSWGHFLASVFKLLSEIEPYLRIPFLCGFQTWPAFKNSHAHFAYLQSNYSPLIVRLLPFWHFYGWNY